MNKVRFYSQVNSQEPTEPKYLIVMPKSVCRGQAGTEGQTETTKNV